MVATVARLHDFPGVRPCLLPNPLTAVVSAGPVPISTFGLAMFGAVPSSTAVSAAIAAALIA